MPVAEELLPVAQSESEKGSERQPFVSVEGGKQERENFLGRLLMDGVRGDREESERNQRVLQVSTFLDRPAAWGEMKGVGDQSADGDAEGSRALRGGVDEPPKGVEGLEVTLEGQARGSEIVARHARHWIELQRELPGPTMAVALLQS